jgi:hypothetical protein
MVSKIRFNATVGVTTLLLCFPSICLAQAQEVLEETGPVRKMTWVPTGEIHKALGTVFETKEFQEKKEFGEFLKKFQKAISKKGKELQIVVDREAFMIDNRTFLHIEEEEITLPPVPTKLVANTAFRLALSQVGRGEANFWLRSGQIVITSNERIRSSYFLKSSYVAGNSKDRPLTDALDELAERSGVSIIVDSRICNKAQTKVAAKFGSAKLETAVCLLTESVGLKHAVVDNVIYVTSPANALEFTGKTDVQLGGTVGGMAFKNRPLLAAIGDVCDWVIDSRVKNKANIRVNAKWINHVEGDTALRILTDMAGLKHVAVDDIVYVTSPANAKKLAEKVRKKPNK